MCHFHEYRMLPNDGIVCEQIGEQRRIIREDPNTFLQLKEKRLRQDMPKCIPSGALLLLFWKIIRDHPSDPLCVLYGAHTFIFPNAKDNALTADSARLLLTTFAQFLAATQAHASFDIYPRTKTYTVEKYLAWARIRCQNGLHLQNLCQRRVFALVSPQDQEDPTCYFEDKPLAPEWIAAQTQVLSEFPALGSLVFGGVGAAPARACINRTVPSLLTALVSRTPMAPTA
jgi:hypothetical protein